MRLKLARSLLLIALPVAWGQTQLQHQAAPVAQATNASGVTVPRRPATPFFKGEQGPQKSEVKFNSGTREVTIKLHVEDSNGYFLPNLRRNNFVVYEDGVRQKNVTVEVEHAPVTIAQLLEFGGRYHELNEALAREVHDVGRQLLDFLGRDDRLAILTYGDKLETLVGFDQGHEIVDGAFERMGAPGFSEVNFYDALTETLNRVRDSDGQRKAVIVVSSGLDTFSKASFAQVLQAAKDVGVPVYTVGLVRVVQREAAVLGKTAPFARIDWNDAEKRLESIARVSGGRAYVLESDITAGAIYDDIMENLRLRYVITYVSSHPAASGGARKIRVELIDPETGQALKIRDSKGKLITARVFIQESYSPSSTTGS